MNLFIVRFFYVMILLRKIKRGSANVTILKIQINFGKLKERCGAFCVLYTLCLWVWIIGVAVYLFFFMDFFNHFFFNVFFFPLLLLPSIFSLLDPNLYPFSNFIAIPRVAFSFLVKGLELICSFYELVHFFVFFLQKVFMFILCSFLTLLSSYINN